jgi:hypothetical protein
MFARDAKRDRAEELRSTSVPMTHDECVRLRTDLAGEYEAVADQWEAISVLTGLLAAK